MSETELLEHFGGQHRFILMAEQTSNVPLVLFSDTESEEEFEGFTARDARPYVEVAVKAPLFCSTPVPKSKRARVESDKFHLSTSSDDGPSISSVKLLPTTRTSLRASSTSSVEGELAPQCKSNKYDQVATVQVSENRNESSSSLEGEISFISETEREKLKDQQCSFTENSAHCSHGSAREVIEHETPNKVPNLASRKRGKLTL